MKDLCDLHAVSVNTSYELSNVWTIRIYIIAPKLISKAYFINSSHQSVCLYVYPSYRR
jgi:hypothetical protein